jgi:hypothetical protein
VAGALLAYPLWFALDGPAHLSGLVWPSIPPGTGGIALGDLVQRNPMTALAHEMVATGGYQGPALPQPAFIGAGALAVAGLGLLVWRRDRRLWLFGALGAVAVVLSLGARSYWTPWRVLAHLPLLQDVVSGRFASLTALCAAVVVGVAVDRTHDAVRRRAARVVPAPGPGARRDLWTGARVAAVVAGAVVAGAAVVPMVADEAGNLPLTTRAVTLPAWFEEAGPHLPPGQVVLAYPAPFALQQSAEGWQAVDGLDYALVGGSGPESLLERAGPERAGQAVISAASFSLDGPPAPSAANLGAVRRALRGWGVTEVVMPDPAPLPRYEQGTNPAAALGLFTLAVGRAPRFSDDAWVWGGVRRPGAARSISAAAFAACTASARSDGPGHLAVPDCVLAASRPAP